MPLALINFFISCPVKVDHESRKEHLNFSTVTDLVAKGTMKTSTHLEYASTIISNILFSIEPA